MRSNETAWINPTHASPLDKRTCAKYLAGTLDHLATASARGVKLARRRIRCMRMVNVAKIAAETEEAVLTKIAPQCNHSEPARHHIERPAMGFVDIRLVTLRTGN
jgi:hypothetical protein